MFCQAQNCCAKGQANDEIGFGTPMAADECVDLPPGDTFAPQAGDEPPSAVDLYESKVGELPKFNKGLRLPKSPQRVGIEDLYSGRSEAMEAGWREDERKTRAIIKAFVKKMVKGSDLDVLTPTGELKVCQLVLSRELDGLKIKIGKGSKSIPLTNLEEIVAGVEVDGVTTPLDDPYATLKLKTGDCITFKFPNEEERGTFVMCLAMFSGSMRI